MRRFAEPAVIPVIYTCSPLLLRRGTAKESVVHDANAVQTAAPVCPAQRFG